ncbi:hypothetical protein [Vibrio sp. D431a]|uniref:hypothetical protein n=1 Tax=Vibrio sp. D431a TaxID=2837388 RepID=UPI002552A777|nr:hypothetical protein [Vibrio sp. D431a]MDK9793904.1 hypothetical protein [Vibrio sp. D431a]
MCETNPRPIQWRKETEVSSLSATKKINNSSATSQEETSLNIAGFSLEQFGLGQGNPEKCKPSADDVFEQIINKVENDSDTTEYESSSEMEMRALGISAGLYTEDDLESAKNEAYLQGLMEGNNKEREQLVIEKENLNSLIKSLEGNLIVQKLDLDSEFELMASAFLKNAANALLDGLYDQLATEVLDLHISKTLSMIGMGDTKVEIQLSAEDFEVVASSCSEKYQGVDFKAISSLSKGDIRVVSRGSDLSIIQESELQILDSIKRQVEEA